MAKSRLRVWAFCWLLLVVVTSSAVAQVDTDGDGLLDVLDATGFDANATGEVLLRELGIEDLDGVSLLTNVDTLSLVSNPITSIESGDFAGLDNLQTLHLVLPIDPSFGRISSIEEGDFEGLDNLQYLSLVFHGITSIEAGDYKGLDNLLSLSMGFGRITSIESGDFAGLDNLQNLSLDHNQITSIESGAFVGLENLQTLHLGTNQIAGIERGAFSGLDNLQLLRVGYSNNTIIESEAFSGLGNLQELHLSGSNSSIESGAFSGLGNLQELHLSGSNTSIESGAFSGLGNLQELHLHSYTNIESGAFSGLGNLQELHLTLNRPDSLLNFAGATFQELGMTGLTIGSPRGFRISFILDDATLNLSSFDEIISTINSDDKVSLVGLTFSDANPTDLSTLLGNGSLNNVWVDQSLFDLYADEFNAFDALDGNTLTVVPLGDCTKDGVLSAADLSCVYTTRSRDAVLTNMNKLPGDLDGDGEVGFGDFLVLSVNFGQSGGSYADGNIDLQDGVGFPDFLILSANFGKATDVTAVPEPAGCWAVVLGVSILCWAKRRRVG